MARNAAASPTAPAAVRLLLLALLPLIALLLYLDGQDYTPDLVDLGQTPSGDAALFPRRLAGLERVGPLRRFNKENLYEYIDGHAEYYLGAGFQGLTVAEYAAEGAGQPQVVVNLYAMGGALNAFGVLVEEAGDQASVQVGSLGFRSSQGVNFIYGPYYVQISLFAADLDPMAAANAVAERLAQKGQGAELAFRFPQLGRVKSTRFVREYYRGMEFFNQVLERSFERDGREIQAFVISGSAEQIQGLEQSLTAFLTEDGIPFESAQRDGLRFVLVRDPYEGEWFYVPLAGQLLGVYAALDDGLAAAVSEFAKTLQGSAKESRVNPAPP